MAKNSWTFDAYSEHFIELRRTAGEMTPASLDPTELMEMAVILCSTLGLRRGETVGLSWGDVDFVSNTVNVQHSYDRFGNLRSPKTAAGSRILPMSSFTADALHRRQAAWLAQCGEGPNEVVVRTSEGSVMRSGTAVVTGDYGNRANPDSLSKWWRANRARLGVTPTRCTSSGTRF